MVTKAEIKRFLPTAKDVLVDAVVDNWSTASDAGISTPKRIRQFLSNIAVETGGLRSIVENMNYTTGARLQSTWPKRFPTTASAQPYIKQPKKLAIYVYGGRMGNDPAPSEDGWIYRGGGMLGTTGRDGYREMGYENNPTVLQSSPSVAFLTAVREWVKRGCNELADADNTAGCRRAINGGSIGLSDVQEYLEKARKVWPDDGAVVQPTPAKQAFKVDQNLIRDVQSRLKDLGYNEVGAIDGKIGKLTNAAILAFKSENGLKLNTAITPEFYTELWLALPRQLSDTRTKAPKEAVLVAVPEVKANWRAKIISAITAGFSGIGAAIGGIFDQFDEAKTYVDPLREYLGSVPGWFWLLLIASISLVIWLISRDGEKKGVEAFQTGARR